MDEATLRQQLQQLRKLNEELQQQHAALLSDHQSLLSSVETLMADRQRLEQRVAELEAINKRLTDMLWGRRSERRWEDPAQGLLPFPEPLSEEEEEVIVAERQVDEAIDAALVEQDEKRRRRRRRPVRSEEFPPHLERRQRVIDLPDEEKIDLQYIGDAVSERMRFERPRVYIERIVRRKYVKRGEPEQGVMSAPAPPAIVEGCRYDFSVMAAMLALKYAFHQPTYRQQDWFSQCGWFPRRSTINHLLNLSVETLQPLYAQALALLQRQRILPIDETRVLLLTRNSLTREQEEQLRRRRKRPSAADGDAAGEVNGPGSVTSYVWLLTGLDELAPYNVFHWSLTRSHSTIDELLSDYQGIVVADAYEAYAHIEQRSGGRIVHASCNTHARREFIYAEKYEPVLSAQIESLYRQLYAIEDRGRTLTPAARYELRQRSAVPLWQRIARWLETPEVQRAALPKTPFGKAVGYLRNQWSALRKYLSDGQIPFTNDQAEQTIRPLTVGRRNWLFLGHPAAAPGRMQLSSVISSAHRHHLIVEDYLEDVLQKLADAQQRHPQDLQLDSPYLLELLPDRWAASHPGSIRQERIAEQQTIAEIKRGRRARRRLLARRPSATR
jgi:transposase